jgi:predicted pyridoxine 5'-phosphate oxidase superfamily flavin-nucleotide-binding protein
MEFASDVAFSESVKSFQRERGSRNSYARMEKQRGGFADKITPEIAAYIAARDSAYLATASAAGQPYVQHRGGPPGFIKVLDPQTLAFADFVGNRQYITIGNLAENDKSFLFLMNYAEAERIKIWGRARIVTGDPQLLEKLSDPRYDARVEQAIVFHVNAWDANCPQHIPRLIHATRVERAFGILQRRIRYLEAMLTDAGIAFTPEEDPSLRGALD